MHTTRRRILQGMGTTGLGVLAGCLGGDGDGDGDDSTDGNRSEGADGTDGNGEGGEDGSAESDVDTPPETPEETARLLVDRLYDDRYESAYEMFAERYRSSVSPGLLERVRLGLDGAGGPFQGLSVEETGVRSGLETVQLELDLERATAPMRVSTTADATLAGFVLNGEYERASYADTEAFEATEHALEPPGCQLGATVTRPTTGVGDADTEAVPGAVIVHGSHPTDRDATIAANAPYRDIAEGLASQGVATLRYDKRSFACNVPAAERTVDRVTVEDALHAVEWFREQEGIRADGVVAVGHSLGGMMAPEIARRDGDLAGIAGLSAPARELRAAFLDQIEYLADVGDLEFQRVAEQRDVWRRQAEQLENDNYVEDETLLGLPGAFWRSIEDYDPVETATALDRPQSYYQGGRDYQVTLEDDFAAWEAAFGDDPSVSLSSYPPLDHVLLPGEGPSVPQAYAVPNEVSASLVSDLASWIRNAAT